MFISRRTDYAIRLLIHLANDPDATVSVKEISEAQDIPYPFARNIQRELVDAGFIATTRGASGGTRLLRPPDEITLYDVIKAVEGSTSCATCAQDPKWCSRMPRCSVHRVWQEIDASVDEALKDKTIASFVTK